MRTRLLAFTVLAVLLIGVVTGGSASAVKREGFRVTPSEPAEAEYPGMGPGCPGCSTRASGGTGLQTTPSSGTGCGGSYVWCDAIPVEIVPPQGLEDDRDIFFVLLELHWDDSQGNDLDLRFYDNAQETGSFQQLGASESTKNPETIRVANADLGEYNVVVINFNGANTGYTVKARITTDPFENPNESVAPDPPKSDDPEPEESEPEFTPPEDKSDDPTPESSSSGPEPTLPPVEGGPVGDDDFDFGFSDLDDRITVNLDDMPNQTAAPVARKADKVSPAVLLASLIGAPALIVGSGVAFAWKRRRELLL